MYGLHPLVPIEYIISIVGGNERNNTPLKILINKITKLEKLQEAKMQAIETARTQ